MRIAIVDDDVAFRRGLAPRVRTATPAAVDEYDLDEFVHTVDVEPYDLLLIDPFPHTVGDPTPLLVQAKLWSSRVVVVTYRNGTEQLAEATNLRIGGYLLKTDTGPELDEAIASHLVDEQPAVSRALAPTLFTMLAGRRGSGRTTTLTSREVDVLRLVARGSSNREIARRLGIAENTVKNHVRHILDKLHVPSRLGAVLVAVRDGVIDVDSID